MDTPSDSSGGGDDEDNCGQDSGSGHQSCSELAEVGHVSLDTVQSDGCDLESSTTQAVDHGLEGTVPCEVSEYGGPHPTPFASPTLGNGPGISFFLGNGPGVSLPSRIAQDVQCNVPSRLCPSAIVTSHFAQYGIRMSPYTSRHTEYIPIPSRLLNSFHPRHGLSNLMNNGSRLTREVALSNIPSGDSFLGLCDSMRRRIVQNNVAEDDERLLGQAEGGCDHQKTPPKPSINPGEIDENEFAEVADPEDQGPIYLQETDEEFLASRGTSMFYPSTMLDTYSSSLFSYDFSLISLSSAIVTNENEAMSSVENVDYNSNINFSSITQPIQSVATENQSNHPIPSAEQYDYSDDLYWISCKVCLIYKWKYVLIPCGHGLCDYCYRRILHICPFCRNCIREIIRVLLSSNLARDPGE